MSFLQQLHSTRQGILTPIVRKFHTLTEPKSDAQLESMAQEAQRLTRHYFGRTMRLFAPLYLSNECINTCKYCGFSRDNPIARVTLEVEQVAAECRHLMDEGFRNILLVAGEHPKFVSNGYLEMCVRRLAPFVPSVSLEVGPMETDDYRPIVNAGAEGLVVYQETYNEEIYADLHVAGPKKDFAWRLACPERAHDAGFRRVGIGALFGLAPWREEALALAAHLDYLQKRCWRTFLTVSLPRMRPAAGGYQPKYSLPDRDYAQLVCALRITFPQVGIVLSTREQPDFRDALIPLGITMMSAGSHTDPGGYTGQGREKLHLTVRGKQAPLPEALQTETTATEQFVIADERSASEIASVLRKRGLEPVWKDWDHAILNG